MEPAQILQELDLVVGRVVAVEDHPGARGHSTLLKLELGPRGEAQAPLSVRNEEAQLLVGTQVVCALGQGDVIVLAVHSHASGSVVVRPAADVEDGSPVA
jgi:tRNA-binding EMAP/Myf-like protein